MGPAPIMPREPRFAQSRIDGLSPIDRGCMFLMFRGRMAKLRGFHQPQHRKPRQPMPERVS